MYWYDKYNDRIEFMASFDTEQEYIDAVFMYIVMTNWGVWINPSELFYTFN